MGMTLALHQFALHEAAFYQALRLLACQMVEMFDVYGASFFTETLLADSEEGVSELIETLWPCTGEDFDPEYACHLRATLAKFHLRNIDNAGFRSLFETSDPRESSADDGTPPPSTDKGKGRAR